MNQDPTTLANEAIAHHQASRIAQAIAAYERFLAAEPAPNPALQHLAGMAYLSGGKLRKAETLLGLAASRTNRADYHFGHGNALHGLKWHARAQKAFEAAVALDPFNADVWFNLGNAAQAAGNDDAAVAAFNRALENDPLLVRALPNLVAILSETGRFDELAQLMRQMHRLAMWKDVFYDVSLVCIPPAADAEGKGDVIETTLRDLLKSSPQDSQVLCLLANFLLMRRDFAKAEALYVKAAKVEGQIGARLAAGVLLARRGAAKSATKLLKQTVASDPDGEQLLKFANLVIQLSEKTPGNIALFDNLCEVHPDSAALSEAHISWLSAISDWKNLARVLEARIQTKETVDDIANLGAVYMNMKQEATAIKYLRKAIKLDRKNYSAWYNLSSVLSMQGREAEAYEAGKTALRICPSLIAAASNVALIAGKMNKIDECERLLKRGLKLNPDSTELLNLLGNTKLRRGDMKGALEYFAKARRNAADDGAQFAMQLMAVNYTADVAPEMVAEMHFKWGDARVAAVRACKVPAPTAMKKKLKIGYLSGDYKNHSCSYFIGPLLENHDPERVDVYCYMTEEFSDEVTQKFRRAAKHWREISKLSDEEAAALIMKDGIDILVDLSGHTSGGRLGIMAMKPAPIQANWLGYPNTTGLPTVDYRFTDALADPPGLTDRYFREQLYRLPNFLCYQPPEHTPDVAPLPAKATGSVTFGCFNNSNKITDEVVAVWARIMKRVPGSKMVLKTSNLSDQLALSAFRKKFERNGVDPDRIECFQGFRNKSDHLMTYSDIDLALDPFPYNGTTTTFESLWMGVPMVTLAGNVHASRVGHSIMTAVGLGELVTHSIDDYVDLAVEIALDPDRIEAYRFSARERLQTSPLMDGRAFAHSMEDAFFDMWQHAVSTTKTPRQAAG